MSRTFGGDEDHPTIVSFSHIYRLQSLYTPISACVVGNVSTETTVVLAAVKKKDEVWRARQGHITREVQRALRQKLVEISTPTEDELTEAQERDAPNHGYTLPTAQNCVVYYLCGYLVPSLLKYEKCHACIGDVSPDAQCLEALLTLQREFKEGSQKRPSWHLFKMFRSIETKVATMLEEDLRAETSWNLLDAMRDMGRSCRCM